MSDIGIDKFSFNSMSIRSANQKNQTRNPTRIIEKENYLSPKINNSIYNNYLKYVSINSNRLENKDKKTYISYSKRLDEEENIKNNNENNNNNKNEETNRNYK